MLAARSARAASRDEAPDLHQERELNDKRELSSLARPWW